MWPKSVLAAWLATATAIGTCESQLAKGTKLACKAVFVLPSCLHLLKLVDTTSICLLAEQPAATFSLTLILNCIALLSVGKERDKAASNKDTALLCILTPLNPGLTCSSQNSASLAFLALVFICFLRCIAVQAGSNS